MYSLVNLSVKPSGFIQAAMYLLLTTVLAVSVFYLYQSPLLLLPIVGVLAFYFIRLQQRGFIYQRSRQWQIKQGHVYKVIAKSKSLTPPVFDTNGSHGVKVKVNRIQVWQSLVLFTYELGKNTRYEIISIDAVEQEAFRQFRCMIKQIA